MSMKHSGQAEKRTLNKLLSIMNNASHHLHTVTRAESSSVADEQDKHTEELLCLNAIKLYTTGLQACSSRATALLVFKLS